MAHDRFVRWRDRRPSDADLLVVLEDYLGGGAEVENTPQRVSGRPWWSVTLPGRPMFPLGRLEEMRGSPRTAAVAEVRERGFEVFVADDHVDVITRHGDEFTAVVAGGFAALCARTWGGALEEG